MFWYIFLLKMCWKSIKYLKMVWFLTKSVFWYIFLLKMCWKSIEYLKMVWILTGTIKKSHIPRPQHRHCIFLQFRVSLTFLIQNICCYSYVVIRCLDHCLVTLMWLSSNTENTCGARVQASSQKSNAQFVVFRTAHAKFANSKVLACSRRISPSRVVSTLVSLLVLGKVHHLRKGGTRKK